MLRWLTSSSSEVCKQPEAYDTVVGGLQRLYKINLLPLEKDFKFHNFYSPLLTDGDFAAKPMVMLIGQYSTGKTTFIKHLLEREYPGLRIGPEPTTDRFVAVMDGNHEQVVPGNASVVDPAKPFSQLSNFGNTFLMRFECAVLPSLVLRGITLIDTPGVLSGTKQTSRGYDFEGVIGWFAERVDLILLIFDAHKLDISDEFRRCINSIRGNDSKIRILLNKADLVSNQQLMRVYGALMWSLGKVIPTPEVTRVYIGSFWDQPLHIDENRKLFEAEANDLFSDIAQLPRNAAVRKLNDFIKRVRLAKVHALLLNYLRKQMPMWGKEAKKKQLIQNLQGVYQVVSQEHGVPIGDFPPISLMQEKLTIFDWHKIPKLDTKRMAMIDDMMSKQIPLLMKLIPAEEAQSASALPQDGTMVQARISPFMAVKCDGQTVSPQWAIKRYLHTRPDVEKYREDFIKLGPNENGMLNGGQVKLDLVKCKLPSSVLHRIWNLADATKDGYLDLYEYALSRHFIEMKLEDLELPATLPESLLPPAAHNSSSDLRRHSSGSDCSQRPTSPTRSLVTSGTTPESLPPQQSVDLLGGEDNFFNP
eukprot:GHVS01086091.1.p1 GENE.GHVS01086091.1~~GHVS01086091.1.p1  ORF type:complete len:589 (+),score=65.39 GHVS01086091.1:2377-4143(+)